MISYLSNLSNLSTLQFFPSGSSEPEDYSGAREVEDLVSFVNSKAGTSRTPDGNLLPTAGRVAVLDAIVEAAAKYDDSFVASLKEAAAALTGKEAGFAKVCVRTCISSAVWLQCFDAHFIWWSEILFLFFGW